MFAKRKDVCFDVSVCFFTLKDLFTVIIIGAVLTASHSMYAEENVNNATDAFEERNRLVDLVRDKGADTLPELQEAINSEREIMRYTAARLLVQLGEPAREALTNNLAHEDLQVRYIVVGGLENLGVIDEYVKELVLDEDAVIRRRFYLDTMPQHLLVDGEPTDELIESFNSAYDAGSERIRHEIIKAVAELPLTESSRALLRRASDQDRAVVAAEGDDEQIGLAEERALMAFRTLLERDIEKMRQLAADEEWEELVNEFGDRDISAWPDTRGRGRRVGGYYANEPAEAYYRLSLAYYELGQGREAERILREMLEGDEVSLGISHFRERGFHRRLLELYKDNYQQNLPEDESVRDSYIRMQLAYGNRLAGAGRESEARSSYKKALDIEDAPDELKESVHEALQELNDS